MSECKESFFVFNITSRNNCDWDKAYIGGGVNLLNVDVFQAYKNKFKRADKEATRVTLMLTLKPAPTADQRDSCTFNITLPEYRRFLTALKGIKDER